MEDLKAYIESGVLELYAIGDLSASERLEVEQMLSRYPELQTELREIEQALKSYAEKHAIEPKDSVRERVLNSLTYNDNDETDKEGAAISPLPVRSINFYKYAFAASVALLFVCLIALFRLNGLLKESNQRIASLEISNQKFSSRAKYIYGELTAANQALEVYQNSEIYKMIELKGLPKSPDSKMRVAFSPQKEVVLIDKASLNLPATDSRHQYQLWALVDGKPVDLGVFDADADTTGMLKMKPLKDAQAFAVTLEPSGGSSSPTLDQMVVMGSF